MRIGPANPRGRRFKDLPTSDLIWMLVSFVLTILVFSYILGDNPVFRVVLAILVGTTAGYLTVVLLSQVVLQKLLQPILSGNFFLTAVPLILSLLLLMKLFPRFSRVGNIPMAFLVGAGAAVVIGGAILGTLITQVSASITQFSSWKEIASGNGLINFLEGGLILFGTIASLLYFKFTIRTKKDGSDGESFLVNWIRSAGKFFIIITLGAMFAGVFSASITALVQRLAFLWDTIQTLIG
jgi:hypothetical protein